MTKKKKPKSVTAMRPPGEGQSKQGKDPYKVLFGSRKGWTFTPDTDSPAKGQEISPKRATVKPARVMDGSKPSLLDETKGVASEPKYERSYKKKKTR